MEKLLHQGYSRESKENNNNDNIKQFALFSGVFYRSDIAIPPRLFKRSAYKGELKS